MLRKTSGFAVILVLACVRSKSLGTIPGREDYQHYCAACREQDGKGKGESTDCTARSPRLSQSNGGEDFLLKRFKKKSSMRRSQPLWHQRLTGTMPSDRAIFQLQEENPASKAKVEARIAAIVRIMSEASRENDQRIPESTDGRSPCPSP